MADSPAAMEPFRRGYDPADPVRLPGDWSDRLERWRGRAFALRASPWDEGLLQVIGIGDWSSFSRAVMLMHENPERIEAMVAHYADFLVALLDRVLGEVDVDYAVLYEVIASNRALVIPPAMYARFALPALRRVVACLERHGVATRVVWTTGRVGPLIPLWLDAGVNGMILTQTAASGIDYPGLRREYGRQLGLLGGLDWQTVMRGPAAIDEMLRRVARPLLEQGGYIPHLDDRVRSYMPFENYRYFRRRLNKLIDDIHGDR
ncbi:MAG: uroporphyrinogen decarboxylase family protein [bacterium]|nr:uroporphyrinogen decarboxylase family protein [bacterium]